MRVEAHTCPLVTWGVREPTNLLAPPGQASRPARGSNTFRWRHLASEEEEFGAVLQFAYADESKHSLTKQAVFVKTVSRSSHRDVISLTDDPCVPISFKVGEPGPYVCLLL